MLILAKFQWLKRCGIIFPIMLAWLLLASLSATKVSEI